MTEENAQAFIGNETTAQASIDEYLRPIKENLLPILLKITKKENWGYIGLLLVGLLLLDVVLEVGGIINSIPIYNNLSQVVFTTWLVVKLATASGRQSLLSQFNDIKKVVVGKVEDLVD